MTVNRSRSPEVFKKGSIPELRRVRGLRASSWLPVFVPYAQEVRLRAKSTSADGDGVLVRRVRKGDSVAFETLVRRHLRAAHALALSVVGREDLADDACQEAFLSALRSIDQCRNPERFKSWLMVIVRNQALTQRSSENRRAEAPLESGKHLAAVEDPFEDLERRELRGVFRAAVEHLSGLRKEVFVLHDVEGLDHAEISRELGISRGASRVHLHFARRILRSQLTREWLEKT